VLEGRQEVLEPTGPAPVLALLQLGRVETQLGHEVDQLRTRLARNMADRITDEFLTRVSGHDHRVAVEHLRGLGHAPPHHRAVPARRTLVGMEDPPHGRVDTVSRDEQPARRARQRRAGRAIDEACAHAAARLRLEADELVAEVQPLGADALAGSLQQHLLQHATVHRDLRPAIAGRHAARLTPDPLAALGVIGELAAGHAGGFDRSPQPHLVELADRVR
jgi:hypothetical protein